MASLGTILIMITVESELGIAAYIYHLFTGNEGNSEFFDVHAQFTHSVVDRSINVLLWTGCLVAKAIK